MAARAAYGYGNANAGKPANGDYGAWGGYRWPNCPPNSLLGTTDYTTKYGQRLRVTVRKELVNLLTLVFKIQEMHNYVVYSNKNGEAWGPWGSECRPVSGTNTPSGHSIGVSVDFNAPYNPYSTTFQSDMPPAMVLDIESCGWYWGGRYEGQKYDPMHFGMCWGPSDVARFEAKARSILGQQNIGTAPDKPAAPAPAPAPLKEDEDNMKVLRNDKGVDHVYNQGLTFFRRVATKDEYLFLQTAGVIDIDHGKAPVAGQNLIDEIEVQVRRNQNAAGFLGNDRMLEILRAPEFNLPGIRGKVVDGSSPAPAPPAVEQYTVVSGDSFGAIAKAKGVTVDALKAANPGVTNVDNIEIGQVLQIPPR